MSNIGIDELSDNYIKTSSNENNETENVRNYSNSNNNKTISTTHNPLIQELKLKLNNTNNSNDVTRTNNFQKNYAENSLFTLREQSKNFNINLSKFQNKNDNSSNININANNRRSDQLSNSNKNFPNENDHVKAIINKFDQPNQDNNYLQNTNEKFVKPGNLNWSNSEKVQPPPLLPKPKQRIHFCLSENFLKPIGFENPKNFSFLNCVVQQFYSCTDFRKELIEYHNCYNIADSNVRDEKKIFVNNFCELMDEISKRNEKKTQENILKIQNHFEKFSFENDVYTCFMNILTVVSAITGKPKIIKSATMPTTPLHSFKLFQRQPSGFVNDLFYGTMVTKFICAKCRHEFNKAFQLFKSILLLIPKVKEIIPLEHFINNYRNGFPVDTDNKLICLCPGGSKNLYSITEYIDMPSYLFIYLDRGPFFENGEEDNAFINSDEILNFPTGESSTKYRLISVIDHIGDNYGGHYYAKSCFETDKWWILNDSFVNLIEDKKSIVTKQAISFLFKKY